MKFKRVDKYYEVSDCGYYTVARHVVGKSSVYFAYRHSTNLNKPAERLGDVLLTADEARERCREHAKQETAA